MSNKNWAKIRTDSFEGVFESYVERDGLQMRRAHEAGEDRLKGRVQGDRRHPLGRADGRPLRKQGWEYLDNVEAALIGAVNELANVLHKLAVENPV